jgi:hypothetical protein
MQFEYEITADDFVAGQMLYHRLGSGKKYIVNAFSWTIFGAFFVLVAVSDRLADRSPILLGVTGIWLIYAGLRGLFPRRYLRRGYAAQSLAGEKYRADVNEEGFEVVGALRSWRVRWNGVARKGEDASVFIIFASNTIFIFGKKYLTLEQQDQLRVLAALPTP